MTKLADIPASIPMPCAPFVDDRDGKLLLWQAIKNAEVWATMDKIADITGFVSAPLFASEKLREIVAAVVERTGAKLAVSCTPWKTGKGEVIGLDDKGGESGRVAEIIDARRWWYWKLGRGPDWLNLYDEAERITDDNRDAILTREIRLWQCVVNDVGTVAFYNARMVREHDVYPYVHPLTLGPSHCSMYLDDNHQNARNLAATKARLDPWKVPVVANVILNKWKIRNGGKYDQGYLDIGAEPQHYCEQGEIIRNVGCSAVVVSECPLLLNGHENPAVVANLGALIDGMKSKNGDNE